MQCYVPIPNSRAQWAKWQTPLLRISISGQRSNADLHPLHRLRQSFGWTSPTGPSPMAKEKLARTSVTASPGHQFRNWMPNRQLEPALLELQHRWQFQIADFADDPRNRYPPPPALSWIIDQGIAGSGPASNLKQGPIEFGRSCDPEQAVRT